ncbi:helix-turn-helix domain-containing protein, partial [Streptomyces sp. NPDC052415]|uniref:helix-turn-helix domain-containing protein n=1 Tax=Streptomyces sp. NPDC052415 TaxID=3365690 RepID=UPI0037D5DC6B
MPETETTFAAELRRLRGQMTLRELGRRASCSKSIISDLEHERRSPTIPIATGLDKALGAGGRLVSLDAIRFPNVIGWFGVGGHELPLVAGEMGVIRQ